MCWGTPSPPPTSGSAAKIFRSQLMGRFGAKRRTAFFELILPRLAFFIENLARPLEIDTPYFTPYSQCGVSAPQLLVHAAVCSIRKTDLWDLYKKLIKRFNDSY